MLSVDYRCRVLATGETAMPKVLSTLIKNEEVNQGLERMVERLGEPWNRTALATALLKAAIKDDPRGERLTSAARGKK
jgi:hypothetical protein